MIERTKIGLLIEKLRGIPPHEEIDVEIIDSILIHYRSLINCFPIGPDNSLEEYLSHRRFDVQPIEFKIETFDDFRAYVEVTKIDGFDYDHYTDVLFDALFRREGWAEQYDEYLEDAIGQIDSPYYYLMPKREDIERTTSKCQLKWWKLAIKEWYEWNNSSEHIFDELKNPHLIELLYEMMTENRDKDQFEFQLNEIGLLRYRTGPSPDLEAHPHRKMYEELLHGRYEYLLEVLNDILQIESWPELQRGYFLKLICVAFDNSSHPLHSLVRDCFTSSRETAKSFVDTLLADGDTYRTEQFMKGNIRDLIDDPEIKGGDEGLHGS